MARAERTGFAHSITDLMASVAVMFLLIAGIFMVKAIGLMRRRTADYQRAKLQQRGALEQLEALRKLLESEALLKGIAEIVYDKSRDPFLLTVVVRDEALAFEPGSCEVGPRGLAVIAQRFPAIFRPVCQTASQGWVQTISLEGHTDQTPFFPNIARCGIDSLAGSSRCLAGPARNADPACLALGYENNVKLSASRAQNVYFETRRVFVSAADESLRECLDTRFVVSGRGPVEPDDGSDWRVPRGDAERHRDRRVVLKIRMRSSIDLVTSADASP